MFNSALGNLVPESGLIRPRIILAKVDLPAPLGPIKVVISPCFIERETSSRTGFPAKDLWIPFKVNNNLDMAYIFVDRRDRTLGADTK